MARPKDSGQSVAEMEGLRVGWVMTGSATLKAAIPLDLGVVPGLDMVRTGPVAGFTADVESIAGCGDLAEALGIIKARAVATHTSIIKIPAGLFECLPRFAVGRL